jgi:hypothetical protein
MSDPRWTDVDADLDSAIAQLGKAIGSFERGGFDSEDEDVAWEKSNAFLHGMETGYTLIEKAILRVLDILTETGPTGDAWHKDLIDRVSRALTGENDRPAIIDSEMKRDLIELLRMRHRARNATYDEFEASKAGPSVEAAKRVLVRIKDVIAKFRKIMDPEPSDDNDGGAAPATPPI